MKPAVLLIAVLSVSLLLSACNTTPERVRVEGEGYKVEVSDGDAGNWKDGKHCPPGHRMKGWC